MNLADKRNQYTRGKLQRADLKADPFEQFGLWLQEATAAGIPEPNAMSLATTPATARPSLRTVLLKQFDTRGFVFFTNLESRKARELADNPCAALLFPWLALQRQVIIEGTVARISTVESIAYFAQRPLGSQLAAWASPQSMVVESRKMLEMQWERMKQKFADGKVPMPSFWGGYRVTPRRIEFWQGRDNRLHDRFQYTPADGGAWEIKRLAP